MAETTYCIEYAKSNRASCKVCKAKIDLHAVRMGTSSPGPGDYLMTSWRHLECQKKPKALSSLTEVSGLDALQPDDKAKVEAWFAAAAAPAGKSAGGKRKAEGDASTDAAIDLSNLKKMKSAELKAALEAYGMPTTGKKKEQVTALEEVRSRQEAEASYAAKSIAELKDTCALNGQLKGGNKQELVDRCVDGLLYGALPKCTLCGGGLLRVVYPSKYGHGGQGRFSCPGFYDDDTFKRCSFTSNSVERDAWKEP